MNLILFYITFVVTIINLTSHVVGSLLLSKLYKWRTITTQQLIICNISICDGLSSCVWIIIHVIELSRSALDSFPYCIGFHLAFGWVLYFLMLSLMLDRLAAVSLGMKYPLYWNVDKTKNTVALIWSLGVINIAVRVILDITGYVK